MSQQEQLAEALSGLLDASHLLHPDDLGVVAAVAAEKVGGRAPELYFADLAQDVLRRFHGSGDDELDIDATIAGRAYRTLAPVTVEVDDGLQAWVPLLDGADRLGVLAAVVDDHDAVRGLESVAALVAEVMVARSQYGDSLALARRRQPLSLASELRWAMLPPLTFATADVTISAIPAPAYEIAGDSFDYSVNGEVAHVAVFDAMGHGLEASRIVNLVMAAYRHARRAGADLLGAYGAIDSVVNREFGDFTFATGALAELHLERGVLRVLLAGHPRPLLLRGRSLVGDLDVAPTLPFGIGDPEPTVGEFQLEPDDLVLLYSDGVVEARNGAGESFGVARLADFLERVQASAEPDAETLRRLSKAIVTHQGTPLEDDATLLSLHWHRQN